ncbi:MAG: DUF4404 family protein [Lentisphaerae bacterium]|nr:DUF4404 family protein [Lentisphaerota bacterium]MCP4101546.1 DUF4404 family protein [Lentisphaerota bacterium]
MSLEKVKKIEKEIKEASRIDDASKGKLLEVIGDLKEELKSLDASNKMSADMLADKAHESTIQAVKEGDDFDREIEGLKSSVEEFEITHPKLVQLVNRFCMMLSDIGI